MTYRILVPLDGSALADQAIPWADELAAALHAEIHLIRVVPPRVIPPVSTDVLQRWLTDVEADAGRRELFAARGGFRNVEPSHIEVLHGPAGEIIAAHANEEADLVTMTTRGRTGLQRALLGSVTATVIREARVPVLVIPPRAAGGPVRLPRRLLLAMDAHTLRTGALGPAVVTLAQGLEWTLTICVAVPIDAAGRRLLELLDAAKELLRRLTEQGLEAEMSQRPAFSYSGVLQLASEALAGLIGAPARSWVTEPLIAHGTMPVLVLPDQEAALLAAPGAPGSTARAGR